MLVLPSLWNQRAGLEAMWPFIFLLKHWYSSTDRPTTHEECWRCHSTMEMSWKVTLNRIRDQKHSVDNLWSVNEPLMIKTWRAVRDFVLIEQNGSEFYWVTDRTSELPDTSAYCACHLSIKATSSATVATSGDNTGITSSNEWGAGNDWMSPDAARDPNHH